MAVSDALIGTLFDGRYKVERRLGSGGMATVYLAEDQELGRRVAIKILNDRHAHDSQFVERFRREAKNAAALSHPNVVSIYDRGDAEGTYYIAMEYLDGRSLKELIVSRGPAPIPVAVDYARQILAALRFAHRNGIVHRDIKPHNVLVDAEGRVKVTDFGIARAGAASQMTEVGSIVGTAQYLSPEQAQGVDIDQRSDIYSLGIVLYELLTGTVPFTGNAPLDIALKHISETPVTPSERRPDIPHDLDMVVIRALAKDPADRYQSAEEMDADLERVARGVAIARETEESATQILSAPTTVMAPATAATMVQPAIRQAPPAPPAPPAAPPPIYYDYDEPLRRRPAWPWLFALGFVIAAGIGGWFLYKQIDQKIGSSSGVAVDNYQGLTARQAEQKVHGIGLGYVLKRQPSSENDVGIVVAQDPAPGVRVEKGKNVTLFIGNGPPKTTVPNIVGKAQTDAVAALTDAHLQFKILQVPNSKQAGLVLAQDPAPGKKVKEGTIVHFNVSKGPQPVAVPGVVGQPVDSATSTLQANGFAVSTKNVGSNQPQGTVVDQSPAAGASVAKGSNVTLSVSKGPQTTGIPDVTSLDEASASQTLQSAGFQVHVAEQQTNDPQQDGIVLSQDPLGGTQAKPGSPVTIQVGRYLPTTSTTPTTPTTAPAPTLPGTTTSASP